MLSLILTYTLYSILAWVCTLSWLNHLKWFLFYYFPYKVKTGSSFIHFIQVWTVTSEIFWPTTAVLAEGEGLLAEGAGLWATGGGVMCWVALWGRGFLESDGKSQRRRYGRIIIPPGVLTGIKDYLLFIYIFIFMGWDALHGYIYISIYMNTSGWYWIFIFYFAKERHRDICWDISYSRCIHLKVTFIVLCKLFDLFCMDMNTWTVDCGFPDLLN